MINKKNMILIRIIKKSLIGHTIGYLKK
ncbi:uncharacterized protein METZ01_LOCUS91251 [marine metagenome]|uniref:Uncharacterized protein n=1 Tax=marine metagenome TaxID=408172 RepID=A0A381VFH4_9ZZZZ